MHRSYPRRAARAFRLSVLAIFLVVATIASACSSGESSPALHFADSGSTLRAHGAFLYVVGGYEADGSPSPGIYAAPLGADGSVGAWSLAGTLPEGRAHAAVISFGDKLYVMGGEGASGPADGIYLFFIAGDGKLTWVNLHSTDPSADRAYGDRLPTPRSRMAAVLSDGRVFLIGGRLADGNPTSSIVHARFYEDGQVGDWYEAQAGLSSPREGIAAEAAYAADGSASLIAAGGLGLGGASASVDRFEIGPSGLLAAGSPVPDLPRSLAYPVLVADGDSILAAGGFYGDSLVSDAAYRYDGTDWSAIEGLSFAAAGPGRVRAAGRLIGLSPVRGSAEPWEIISSLGLVSTPEPPIVFPGSGLVPMGADIQVSCAPSDATRYAAGKVEVAIADSIWPSTGQSLSASMDQSFRAFGPGSAASGTVLRSWATRSDGLVPTFVPISPDGSTRDLAAGWYRFSSGLYGKSALSWQGGGISVYEYDRFTWALDEAGAPVDYPLSSVTGPGAVELRLSPDKYYVYCEPAVEGGTVSLSVGLISD